MTILRSLALLLALAVLAADAGATGALAQSSTGRDLALRERLERARERERERRLAGERRLEGEADTLELRRRLLLRQRDNALGSQRSEPILPRTNRSSVVVTQ